MARTILDTQLHEMRTRVIRLGKLVATALEQALQAMQSSGQALNGLVIASDSIKYPVYQVPDISLSQMASHLAPSYARLEDKNTSKATSSLPHHNPGVQQN